MPGFYGLQKQFNRHEKRHFIPNLFFEVSKENIEAKINAMQSYENEKRKYPHPRSPEALRILAKMYGVTVGKEYAEPFNLIRGSF